MSSASSVPAHRFYKTVTVDAVSSDAGAGFRILLDGRAVRTPGRAEGRLPTRALAEAVAVEWAAQGDNVDPQSMPLTGLAWTALDRVRPARAEIVTAVSAFAAHDLLCYRAAGPADLAARQQEVWQPLLDWLALTFDAPLAVTAGIVSVEQPAAALAALERAVAARDDFALAALSAATAATGSLVIALALVEGGIDSEAAFTAAQLDETYQIERWGEDPEHRRRRDAIRADLAAVERFVGLLAI